MFEVILGLSLLTVFAAQVYSLYLISGFENDSQALESVLERIEGKLQLSLEAIDSAVDDLEPPTVGEHLASIANMWMQGRMMDKMQGAPGMPQQLNEEAPPGAEVWPADVMHENPDASQ
tara:strand:- start:590 stop:946 length:357 start_codon:yes stop_codon:yes gene_type:complete